MKNSAGTTVASYTYDGAGNIKTATENGTTVSYTYGNSNWADLLTAYNGQTITYDAIGNPTNYLGWTMTWENGRQLASASKNGTSLSYTYDADGLRATKTVNGEEHTYIYNGGKLTLEKYGTKLIEYLYTPDGQPYSLRYSTQSGAQNTWSAYYYIVNQQGDVIALTNATGSVVAKYSYDAWGKVTSVRDASNNIISSSTHIGNINPIRYRGYYYDVDTQLYYLQSRYYDPEVGRFINADGFVSTGQSFAGWNMFTYCTNNPITHFDSSGQDSMNCWRPESDLEYRLVGVGAQVEIDIGTYCTGLEIIVYFDPQICDGNNGDFVIEGYTYEGVSIDAAALMRNPQTANIIEELSAAAHAMAGMDPSELGSLKMPNFFHYLQGDVDASASVVAVLGTENFTAANQYTGTFDSFTINYGRRRVSFAYAPSCITLSYGLSTASGLGLSLGKTYYKSYSDLFAKCK